MSRSKFLTHDLSIRIPCTLRIWHNEDDPPEFILLPFFSAPKWRHMYVPILTPKGVLAIVKYEPAGP